MFIINKMNIVSIATIVGFFGDMGLQILLAQNLGGPSGWGLKPYFERHGQVESLFTAAGLMGIVYIVYIYMLRLPLNPVYLVLYGIVLDVIFRIFNIFPSLSEYHEHQNYFNSIFWGTTIPLLIPYYLSKGINI
jgi:hypothetical protein